MQTSPIVDIYLRYRDTGIRVFSSFLFPLDSALKLLDDTEAENIACWGVTGWFRSINQPGWLGEDYRADYSVPANLLDGADAAAKSTQYARMVIREKLTPRHEFVLLEFRADFDRRALAAAWDAMPGPTYPRDAVWIDDTDPLNPDQPIIPRPR